jgi:hypothetical protein
MMIILKSNFSNDWGDYQIIDFALISFLTDSQCPTVTVTLFIEIFQQFRHRLYTSLPNRRDTLMDLHVLFHLVLNKKLSKRAKNNERICQAQLKNLRGLLIFEFFFARLPREELFFCPKSNSRAVLQAVVTAKTSERSSVTILELYSHLSRTFTSPIKSFFLLTSL